MEVPSERCNNCRYIPEEILMLACEHDLCLNCAATIFVAENPDGSGQALTCLECGKSTELDRDSVFELQRIHVELLIAKKKNNILRQHDSSSRDSSLMNNITSSGIKQQQQQQLKNPGVSSSIQHGDNEDQDSHSHPYFFGNNRREARIEQNLPLSSQQQQQPSNSQHSSKRGFTIGSGIPNALAAENNHNISEIDSQKSPQSASSSSKAHYPHQRRTSQSSSSATAAAIKHRYCTEHHDEEIMYFCFQCSSRCICPECVIHGAHKNHDVKTIKKAYPVVRARVDEFSSNIGFKLKELSSRSAQLDAISQDLSANAGSLKSTMKLQFSELRAKIDTKEREYMNVCDRVLSDNLKAIETLKAALIDKQGEFAQTIELVFDHANQEDETLLLDFYATNQSKLEEIKNNRDWEQKLLNITPEFYRISQREVEKSLLLLESYVARIEPQLEVNDTLIAKRGVSGQKDQQKQYDDQGESAAGALTKNEGNSLIDRSQRVDDSLNKNRNTASNTRNTATANTHALSLLDRSNLDFSRNKYKAESALSQEIQMLPSGTTTANANKSLETNNLRQSDHKKAQHNSSTLGLPLSPSGQQQQQQAPQYFMKQLKPPLNISNNNHISQLQQPQQQSSPKYYPTSLINQSHNNSIDPILPNYQNSSQVYQNDSYRQKRGSSHENNSNSTTNPYQQLSDADFENFRAKIASKTSSMSGHQQSASHNGSINNLKAQQNGSSIGYQDSAQKNQLRTNELRSYQVAAGANSTGLYQPV